MLRRRQCAKKQLRRCNTYGLTAQRILPERPGFSRGRDVRKLTLQDPDFVPRSDVPRSGTLYLAPLEGAKDSFGTVRRSPYAGLGNGCAQGCSRWLIVSPVATATLSRKTDNELVRSSRLAGSVHELTSPTPAAAAEFLWCLWD